jgi:hypothetical protein
MRERKPAHQMSRTVFAVTPYLAAILELCESDLPPRRSQTFGRS